MRALVRNIMIEAEAVAAKLGMELPVSIDQRIAGAEKVGRAQDVDAAGSGSGRPMELEAMVGAVVELGERLGVPMPHTRSVYACTKLLDRVSQRSVQAVNRWFRLAPAVVAMIMIANLQYAWTLFVEPLHRGAQALETFRRPVGVHALHRL